MTDSSTKRPSDASTYQKGLLLESRVVEIYRQLGAHAVKTNLRLAGQQVDVFVVTVGSDGFETRLGIDCKNYSGHVGVNEVNTSAQKTLSSSSER